MRSSTIATLIMICFALIVQGYIVENSKLNVDSVASTNETLSLNRRLPILLLQTAGSSVCFVHRTDTHIAVSLISGLVNTLQVTTGASDETVYTAFIADTCIVICANKSMISGFAGTIQMQSVPLDVTVRTMYAISSTASSNSQYLGLVLVAFQLDNANGTAQYRVFGISPDFNIEPVDSGSDNFDTTQITDPINFVSLHEVSSSEQLLVTFATDNYLWARIFTFSGTVYPAGSPSYSYNGLSPLWMSTTLFSNTSCLTCYVNAATPEQVDCMRFDPLGATFNEDRIVLPIGGGSLPAISRSRAINQFNIFTYITSTGNTHVTTFTTDTATNITTQQLSGAFSASSSLFLVATDENSKNTTALLGLDNAGQMVLIRVQQGDQLITPTSSPTEPGAQTPSGPMSPSGSVTNPTSADQLSQEGIIAVSVVVPVVVLAAGLLLLLLLLRRRKKRQNGGSLLHGKSRVEIAMESIDDRLKIPYKALVFKKEIGAGSYGKVFFGEWKGTPVAIKVSSSVSDMDGFFDEARITVGLQQHPNVVQTFGVSLDGQLPCIVLEFCEGGSLDNRLFDSDVSMTLQQKISLIKGVARGLYHLHSNNIVHRDLAARNVLLNKSGTPKISDFGMSRVLKSEAEKGKTRTNYGPIRWMAPESLKDLQYSTKSDVWSFGIVVYEILNRSEPHIDVDPLEVAVKIKNEAYHPPVPVGTEPVLRELLLSCWQPDPNNRPSMEEICTKLNSSFPDNQED